MDKIVSKLQTALGEQVDLLEELAGCLQTQLRAVEERDTGLLTESVKNVERINSRLGRLDQTRTRQLRLMRRFLGLSEDASLRHVAEQLASDKPVAGRRLLDLARQLKETARLVDGELNKAEEAMAFAAKVGRQLLMNLQHPNGPPASQVYTAAGGIQTQGATPPSILNTTS